VDFIKREKDLRDVKLLSPLIWAYVGDSIYEQYIRTHLINTTRLKPQRITYKSY